MLVNKDNLLDEQLMKLYQNGDEEAFKVLYSRHSSKIYGFLKKRLNSNDKVPEVYQEVFIKIHKSKHLYNDSLPLLAWIFTVTRTVMIDEIRKDNKIRVADNYDLEQIPEELEKTVPQFDQALDNLQQLPEQQKAAIEMRYLNDQTFEQIAESLNVSPSNARQIISRGVKRLRELIGEGGKS
ncbi:MAG: RNA polymerase sigma factor [Pseudobdellovibrio sp.]